MLLPLLEYLLQSIQLFILLIWAIWLFLEVWSFWLHYSAGAQLVPYFWPFLELFHVDQGEKYSNINLNHCWINLTPQPIMSNDFYFLVKTLFRKIYQQFGTFGIMFVTFSITTYIIVFILTFYDVRILDQTVPLQWVSYFCRLLWNSSSTCFNCWFTIWSYSHWANVNHGRFIASWNTITNSKIYLNYSPIWWQNFKNVQEIKIPDDFMGTDQTKAKKIFSKIHCEIIIVCTYLAHFCPPNIK